MVSQLRNLSIPRPLDDLMWRPCSSMSSYQTFSSSAGTAYIKRERNRNLLPHSSPPSTKDIRIPQIHQTIMSGNFNPSPQPAPKETFSPADNFRGQPRPEHHLHRESEPLPGNHSTSNDQCESEDPSIWERRRDTGTPFVCRLFPTGLSFVRYHRC